MISYKPLEHTLIKKDVKLSDLTNAGISTAVIAKFRKNQHVNTSTIEKLCVYLDCRVEEVIEFIPDDADLAEE